MSPVSAPESQAGDQLDWISDVLWPDGSARLVAGSGPPADSTKPWWWASPRTGPPQLLIPADAPAAAGQAVRRYHDGFDLRQWGRSVAAEVTMARPGLAHRLLDHRAVVVDGPADAVDRGVLGGLRQLLGRDDLRFAISLARPKSNRKPVIQLLDESGLVLGWAKVGWNRWTDGLVTNEARWLLPPSRLPLITPTLLEDTVLAGRRVIVVSSVAPSRRPNLNRFRPHGTEVIKAIAERGMVSSGSVLESTWWTTVQKVAPAADDRERTIIEATGQSMADIEFSLGAWHGDFTPWNVMTVRGLAEVIDWELAADQVPLGFDLCHYNTQVAKEMLGLSTADAIDYSARLSPQGLDQLGVDPRTRIATWNLYLVELLRRTLALRMAGVPTDDVHYGAAALRRLDRPARSARSLPSPPPPPPTHRLRTGRHSLPTGR